MCRDGLTISARAAAESLLLRLPVSIISDLVAENPQSLGPVAGDLMRRHDAARTMILEAAAHQNPVVRQQRGGQRAARSSVWCDV